MPQSEWHSALPGSMAGMKARCGASSNDSGMSTADSKLSLPSNKLEQLGQIPRWRENLVLDRVISSPQQMQFWDSMLKLSHKSQRVQITIAHLI